MANASEYRAWVIAQLKPLLPKGWVLSDTELSDVPRVPSIELLLQSIAKTEALGAGERLVTYTLNLITPGDSDQRIDDAGMTLLNALDEVPNIIWKTAQRAEWPAVNPTSQCFTISIQTHFSKE